MEINKIKIFLSDCDGVLTDSGMYYFEDGNEAKKFNTRDGMGFKILKEKNIKIGIITGENTNIVKKRAEKLKLDILYTGIENKGKVLDEICDTYKVSYEEVAYVGDDINDIEIIEKVKMSFCPKDAHKEVKERVQYVMNTNGGQGVIREIVDSFFRGKK